MRVYAIMPYLIDRQQAWRTQEIVVVVSVRQRRVRSRVMFGDNSLHDTLTRPRTLRWRANTRAPVSAWGGPPAWERMGGATERAERGARGRTRATGRKPQ